MKQEDEEFEKLLGEIPHAMDGTSHVDGACMVQKDGVSSVSIAHHGSPLPRQEVFGELFPVDDPKCHEEHPCPLSYVMAAVATEDCQKFSSNAEEPIRHRQLLDKANKPLMCLGFTESHPQDLSEELLITAMSKTTLEAEPTQLHEMIKSADGVEELIQASFSPHGTLGAAVSVDLNGGAMASAFSDTMKVLPRELGISASCGNGHSFNGYGRQVASDGNLCSSTKHASCGGGRLFADTSSGTGPNPMRSTNDGYSRIPSLYADGRGSINRVVAYANGNGISSHTNELSNPTYYGSGSWDHSLGVSSGLHSFPLSDRVQLSSNNFPHMQFLTRHAEPQANYTHSFASMAHEFPPGYSGSSFCQAPPAKMCRVPLSWPKEEDERQMMQQLFDYHSQAFGCTPHCPGSLPLFTHPHGVPPFYAGTDQVCRTTQANGPLATNIRDWQLQFCQADPANFTPRNFVPNSHDNFCTFSSQGFCSRGNTCPFAHSKPRSSVRSKAAFSKMTSLASREKPLSCPVKILSREGSRVPLGVGMLPCDSKAEAVTKGQMYTDTSNKDYQLVHSLSASPDVQWLKGTGMVSLEGQWPKEQLSSQVKYSSLAEVKGHIYSVARDQHGCRFLQRQFDEGGPDEVETIFSEIIDHVLDLMTDPFGNYLVQKLLEVCNDAQRFKILETTTANGELINVSLNMHGTRAVQKLIEMLTTSEEVSMVTASLRPGVVTLIKDLNGNHVIQRCLQHLTSEDSQFIFDVVTSHCVEIATHRHGCCVLQRCIDFSTGLPQRRLIAEVAANALLLSQDPFGNYVVQYILDLGLSWVAKKVMEQLAGNYAHLSMQKFSSNVVEKCLKFADEEEKTRLIYELMENSHLLELLQDPYANYVIQSALVVSKGALHASLVEAICPHTPFLRSSPYGKRILSRRNL